MENNEVSEIITILEKNGVFASIGVITNATGGMMTSRDPRNTNPPFYRETSSNPQVALNRFAESVKVSIERGWQLVYSGQRLHG